MNAPFKPATLVLREADLADRDEFARLERFVAEHPEGTPFHRPTWLRAVAQGTGNRAIALVAERGTKTVLSSRGSAMLIRLSAMNEAGRSGLSSAARPTLAQNSTWPCTVRNSALAAARAALTKLSSIRTDTVLIAISTGIY